MSEQQGMAEQVVASSGAGEAGTDEAIHPFRVEIPQVDLDDLRDPADAFHVVAPSLPGFGFSMPVREPGWELGRSAKAFAELMRTTLHLVTADDCLALYPLLQPMHRSRFASTAFARNLAGVDMDELLVAGRAALEERPRTLAALGKRLQERWPGHDAMSLAYAARFMLPLVQIPPRGVWGASGAATWTTAESWLGRPEAAEPTGAALEELVLRYLGAFGPATVNDVQAWCWLTRLREVVERLRPRLVTFRDEAGNELFDLPDAPRPDPETPAPPRFLPEYDNVLLSHADRSRVMTAEHTIPLLPGNGGVSGTLLVDGFFRGVWKLARRGDAATLRVELFELAAERDQAAVAEEGARLLAFVAGDGGARAVEVVEAG